MKAAWFERFGAARDVLLLGERAQPQPGPGEVLVRLATSGVNPSDVKKRAGSMPTLLDDGPVIPHSDGAGIIEAVGEGVSEGRRGERVWVYQAQHGRRFGTAAEFVTLDERRAARLPGQCSFAIGACIGIPVMTAHRCVFADGPVEGQSVLVTGGAGRVGYYAVQWAAQAGGRVIATASNESDAEACRTAGAAAVVNHRQVGWSEPALDANGGKPIDRVIDLEFGQNLDEVLNLLRTSGTLVTYGSAAAPEPKLPFYRMMFMDLLVRMVIVYDMPEQAKADAIADITRALEKGNLHHRVARVLPLAEISRAHEVIEEGSIRGSVVVDIDGADG